MAMEAPAVLIRATVYDPVTATTKILNFANRDDPRVTTWNNEAWRPILMKSPAISMSVFNGDFTGSGGISVSGFSIMLLETDLDTYPQFTWHGAKIEIYAGDADSGSFTKVATVVGNGANREGRVGLLVEVKTYDELFDRNILFFSYAGTGDIEGGADVKGILKPAVFGDAKNCQPVLIDPVRQIYQVHGYGPVEAIYAVYEGGAAIGTGGNPVATQTGTYVAFRDTVVAQGQWIRHNNLGLIKLGSQPSFPISVDARGDTNGVNGAAALKRPGAVIKRLIELNTSAILLKVSSFTNFDALAPYDVDLYIENQTTLTEAVQYVLRSVGGYWSWDEDGRVILGLMRFAAATVTLSGLNDQEPTVLTINQMATSAPVWSLRVGGAACHYVHDASSVVQSIADLGAADAANAQSIADLANVTSQVFPPGPTPPVGAVEADMWPDTNTIPPTLRRFNGTTWVSTATVGAVVGTSLVLPTGVAVPSAELLNSSLVLSTTGGLTYGSGATAVAVGAITNLDFGNVGNATGTRPANNATVGADVNLNVIDTGSGLGNEVLPRALVRTSLGNSAGFNGEGYYARRNYYQLGETGTGTGDRGAGRTEAGAEWTTNALIRTPSGTAAAYSGQKRYGKVSQFRLGETGEGTGDYGAGYTEGNAEWMNNNLIRTPSGIASSFTGQKTLASRRYIRLNQTENGAGDEGALLTNAGEWSTDVLVRTPSGVSSSIAGQRNYATRSHFRLGETGNGSGDYGAGYTENNAEWTNNALLRTPSGIASSVVGQGPWTTDQRNPSTVFAASANILRNGGLSLGLAGFSTGTPWTHTYGGNEGSYIYVNVAGGYLIQSDPVPIYATGDYNLQGELYAEAVGVNGYVACDLQYFSDAGATVSLGYGSSISAGQNIYWPLTSNWSTAPAGAVSCRVRIYTGPNATATSAVRRIKLSRGRAASPFSDEATDGANAARFTGRAPRASAFLPPSWTAGIRAITSDFPISDSDNAGVNVTINIAAHTKTFDDGATASYPSASFGGHAYGTTYYWWRNDPNLDGGSNYGSSSNLSDARGTDKVYLGAWTTRTSSGGSGGGTPPGGNCVASCSFVQVQDPTDRPHELIDGEFWLLARLIVKGDFVLTLEAGNVLGWREVTSNSLSVEPGVVVALPNGHRLSLAASTPMTLADGTYEVLAGGIDGMEIASLRQSVVEWLPCDAEPIG